MYMFPDRDYFSLFTAKNAKYVSIFALFIVSIYHLMLKLHYGEDSCVGLLEDGRYQGDHIWQPYGCMLHMYTYGHSRSCLNTKNFAPHAPNWVVFMGDSRMRQLYYSFTNQVSVDTYMGNRDQALEKKKKHSNLEFIDSELNLTVNFIWQPSFNDDAVNHLRRLVNGHKYPNMLVLGAATWSIKETNSSLKSVESYKRNVSKLTPYLTDLTRQIPVLWFMQPPVDEDKRAKEFNQTSIKNDAIEAYNDAAVQVLSYTSVRIWYSSRLLSQHYQEDSDDGLHMGSVALSYDMQILYNLYCNARMNYPDGTCCSHSEHRSPLQTAVLLSFVLCVSIALVCLVSNRKKRVCYTNGPSIFDTSHQNGTPFQPMGHNDSGSEECSSSGPSRVTITRTVLYPPFGSPVFQAWTRMCAIMIFVYICDRSSLFMKENKWFTYFNFFLPVCYLGALGIFFTEETAQTSFLHRDQTDEWKGWMQFFILTYHITGGVKVLWIYMLIRCLVSSYFFLSGYCHFCYFWTTGDFSLRRVAKVLFRYNFLAFMLCLTMNRPYQFYYFVPVISFWFVVCYITMATGPVVTAHSVEGNPIHYFYVVLKFVILIGVISVLYLSEIFFENVFMLLPWRHLFMYPETSISEWWFRWKLDRYSAPAGMIFAFLVHTARSFSIIRDNDGSNLFSRRLTALAVLGCLVGSMTYCGFVYQCSSRTDCNEVHSYISFLPIICYIGLRNVFGGIRTRVSSLFAWFGRISLELYVVQYHIWLAADTHGVLVLFPRWPVFNVILTSFIFVCISHEIRAITVGLTTTFVPEDNIRFARNLMFVFLGFCALEVVHYTTYQYL